MPIINIAVFGPVDQGKSTLIGYLYTAVTSFDLNSYLSRIRTTDWYREDMKYAYLVDRLDEERRGHLEEKKGKSGVQERRGIGTSRDVHHVDVRLNNRVYMFIDNPGHADLIKSSSRGVFQGDHGVFVLAADDLMKNYDRIMEAIQSDDYDLYRTTTFKDFLLPLTVAINFGMENLIVTLSKMDTIGYSKVGYTKCEELIRKFLTLRVKHGAEKVSIVPIAIDVHHELDHNVVTSSERLSGYGKTLLKALEGLPDVPPSASNRLYIPVEKFWTRIPGHSLVVAGKIMAGRLEMNKPIKFGPVKPKGKGKPYSMLLGRVKSVQIRSQSSRPQTPITKSGKEFWSRFSSKEVYDAGSIVSISIVSAEREVKYLSHQIVTDATARVSLGRVASIHFGQDTPTLYVGEECRMLIDGRFVPNPTFIGFDRGDGEAELHSMELNVPVAVPFLEDSSKGPKVVLLRNDGIYSGNIVRSGECIVQKIKMVFELPIRHLELAAVSFFVERGLIRPEDLAKNDLEITIDVTTRNTTEMRQIRRKIYALGKEAVELRNAVFESYVKIEPTFE